MKVGEGMLEKKEVRRSLLQLRRSKNQAWIAEQSKAIVARISDWPLYQQAKTIFLYLAMPDEPNLKPLIEAAWQAGKTVCIPHMRAERGLMDAAAFSSWNALTIGKMGLAVPKPECLMLIEPAAIDLIFVPAVAYTPEGLRLGMGAGYYDRFLPQASQACLAGVTWQDLVLPELPTAAHDVPVQYVITEKEIWHCR